MNGGGASFEEERNGDQVGENGIGQQDAAEFERPRHTRIPGSTSSLPDLNTLRNSHDSRHRPSAGMPRVDPAAASPVYSSTMVSPIRCYLKGLRLTHHKTPEARREKWKEVINSMIKMNKVYKSDAP
jgi:hypothetical protein